jgi:aryl-alcohol dehydrogenase-like predicted oxidoreductase
MTNTNQSVRIRLILGTVQFGLKYGISNVKGQPRLEEVQDIFNLARSYGVETLDTAAVYGEAESVIGSSPESSIFKIITKTLPVKEQIVSQNSISDIQATLERSLVRLRRDRIEGVLVHHGCDLLKPGADGLHKLLCNLKDSGVIKRIGVSVYDPEEADKIISRYPIDIIQLPFNILDQRASRSGLFERSRSASVEIHVRSAFLQGALLMAPDQLPAHLLKLRPVLSKFRNACDKYGWTAQEACLRFVAGTAGVDQIVCGVNSAKELSELVSRFRSDHVGFDFSSYSNKDLQIINPSNWPKVSNA